MLPTFCIFRGITSTMLCMESIIEKFSVVIVVNFWKTVPCVGISRNFTYIQQIWKLVTVAPSIACKNITENIKKDKYGGNSKILWKTNILVMKNSHLLFWYSDQTSLYSSQLSDRRNVLQTTEIKLINISSWIAQIDLILSNKI
jgi:hypothetical protein